MIDEYQKTQEERSIYHPSVRKNNEANQDASQTKKKSLKRKAVKYLYEDNVELFDNKKNSLFGSKPTKYYMLLTD